jgi:Protein of unknown function (DUF5674)
MYVIDNNISIAELTKMQHGLLGLFVKAVVDIKKNIMAIDGLLHIQEMNLLREKGSQDVDLWCVNLYPEKYPDDSWIEYATFLNIRPDNQAVYIQDPVIREKIKIIVNSLTTG